MGAEDGARTFGHLFEFLHEDRAGLAEFVHHVLVVNDLLADVDRRSVQIQGDLDYIDSPDDAGAETSRFKQKDFLVRAVIRCERLKRHCECDDYSRQP